MGGVGGAGLDLLVDAEGAVLELFFFWGGEGFLFGVDEVREGERKKSLRLFFDG